MEITYFGMGDIGLYVFSIFCIAFTIVRKKQLGSEKRIDYKFDIPIFFLFITLQTIVYTQLSDYSVLALIINIASCALAYCTEGAYISLKGKEFADAAKQYDIDAQAARGSGR